MDRAIEIAKRVAMPLKIAAKVDRADRRYFKRDIEPLLNSPTWNGLAKSAINTKTNFLATPMLCSFPLIGRNRLDW